MATLRKRWPLAALVIGLFVLVGIPALMFLADPVGVLLSVQRGTLLVHGVTEQVVERPGEPPVTFYEGGGSGETVVLVHSFGDQAGSWGTVVEAIAGDHRVVVPELPGHGRSPAPEAEGLTLAYERDALLAVLQATLEPGEAAVLVGNSMGGWLAQLVALDHPELVSHLVLVNSAGMRHPLDKELVWPRTVADFDARMNVMMAEPTPLPGFLKRSFVAHFAGLPLQPLFDDAASGALHTDARLAQLTVPATLIWGVDDGFFPMAYAERLQAAIPGATLVPLVDCGHAPQLECVPALLAALPLSEGPR